MKTLVADDSKSARLLVARLLKTWGFEVVSVENGAAALMALHEDRKIQLAILDWEMPPLDGLKVCAELQKIGRFVYSIILTGKQKGEDLERAFASGANDFIRKPFQPIELRSRVLAAKRIIELQTQLLQAEKLESIGQLAAGIAHEINTPAQYVGDNVEFLQQSFSELGELLKKYRALQTAAEAGDVSPELVSEVSAAAGATDIEFLEEEIPRALAQSREGIDRVTKIVRAMKEFSHPGSEEKKPFDLNRAIESTVTVARNEWKYVAELEMDFDADLPPVPCLVGELNPVVLNIVVNAAHALAEAQPENSVEKGKIRVKTRSEGEWAVIEISDNGTGIPEEIRSKIFDPFFTTKTVGKGSGQGLAIARSVVVDKHGGTIEVESALGEGTTFRIRLPFGENGEEKRNE
jgi:signal transduction histidine kinase